MCVCVYVCVCVCVFEYFRNIVQPSRDFAKKLLPTSFKTPLFCDYKMSSRAELPCGAPAALAAKI